MKIIDYDMSGRGVAKCDGKVFFVSNALVNEEVEVEVVEQNKHFCRAQATKIISISPQRCTPLCAYYGKCGGCQLQHMTTDEGLSFKQNLIKNTLKKVGGIDAEVQSVIPSKEQYFYRNKSVFVARPTQSGVAFGMYGEASHEFIEIQKCVIANEQINLVLQALSKFYSNRREPNLKHIVIRALDGAFILVLVEKGRLNHLDELIKFLSQSFSNFGVFINHNSSNKAIMSNKFRRIYGLESLPLVEHGVEQKIYPGSFLQVNNSVKEALYQKIVEQVDDNAEVVDAYCGAGFLTYLVSQKAKIVKGIESVAAAIKSARELIESANAQNVEFILGDVKDALPQALKNMTGPLVILDPPRKGCDKAVTQTLIKSSAKKIIYVSCDPISLAKDLALLIGGGFNLTLVQPFDMFPNTSGVETLCVLRRN